MDVTRAWPPPPTLEKVGCRPRAGQHWKLEKAVTALPLGSQKGPEAGAAAGPTGRRSSTPPPTGPGKHWPATSSVRFGLVSFRVLLFPPFFPIFLLLLLFNQIHFMVSFNIFIRFLAVSLLLFTVCSRDYGTHPYIFIEYLELDLFI